MKKIVVKGLGAVGALASLFSGIFWYLSAGNQMATAGKISLNSTAIEKLTYLGNQQNFWAAALAMVAGIAIGLAIFFDD